MTEFVLPELGENIETGDVVRVLVHAGDTLQRDQPILVDHLTECSPCIQENPIQSPRR